MEAFYVRPDEILIEQGPSIGALFTIYSIAQKLGIISALEHDQQAKLAIWQVCARVIEQNAKLLKATRLEIPTYLYPNKVDIRTHKQTKKAS
jgi:hypothetical protein